MDVVVGGDELANARRDLEASIDRKRDHPHEDRAFERMQPELERRGHAEVSSGAAEAPEQVRILLVGSPDLLSVGRYKIDRQKVVDRQAEFALQAAHYAAEGQARPAPVPDY